MSAKLARRMDAEDVVQSAFRSFFSGVNRDQFQLEESGDLWRLLVVIALNKLRRQAAFHGAAKRQFKAEQSVRRTNDNAESQCFEVAATTPLPEAELAVLDELKSLNERSTRGTRASLNCDSRVTK